MFRDLSFCLLATVLALAAPLPHPAHGQVRATSTAELYDSRDLDWPAIRDEVAASRDASSLTDCAACRVAARDVAEAARALDEEMKRVARASPFFPDDMATNKKLRNAKKRLREELSGKLAEQGETEAEMRRQLAALRKAYAQQKAEAAERLKDLQTKQELVESGNSEYALGELVGLTLDTLLNGHTPGSLISDEDAEAQLRSIEQNRAAIRDDFAFSGMGQYLKAFEKLISLRDQIRQLRFRLAHQGEGTVSPADLLTLRLAYQRFQDALARLAMCEARARATCSDSAGDGATDMTAGTLPPHRLEEDIAAYVGEMARDAGDLLVGLVPDGPTAGEGAAGVEVTAAGVASGAFGDTLANPGDGPATTVEKAAPGLTPPVPPSPAAGIPEGYTPEEWAALKARIAELATRPQQPPTLAETCPSAEEICSRFRDAERQACLNDPAIQNFQQACLAFQSSATCEVRCHAIDARIRTNDALRNMAQGVLARQAADTALFYHAQILDLAGRILDLETEAHDLLEDANRDRPTAYRDRSGPNDRIAFGAARTVPADAERVAELRRLPQGAARKRYDQIAQEIAELMPKYQELVRAAQELSDRYRERSGFWSYGAAQQHCTADNAPRLLAACLSFHCGDNPLAILDPADNFTSCTQGFVSSRGATRNLYERWIYLDLR